MQRVWLHDQRAEGVFVFSCSEDESRVMSFAASAASVKSADTSGAISEDKFNFLILSFFFFFLCSCTTMNYTPSLWVQLAEWFSSCIKLLKALVCETRAWPLLNRSFSAQRQIRYIPSTENLLFSRTSHWCGWKLLFSSFFRKNPHLSTWLMLFLLPYSLHHFPLSISHSLPFSFWPVFLIPMIYVSLIPFKSYLMCIQTSSYKVHTWKN